MSENRDSAEVLLVNPWIIDFKAFDLWMKPMGLLYISSVLKRNGFGVSLVDCMDRGHHSVEGREKIRKEGTGKFCSVEITKPLLYETVPRVYKRYGIPVKAFLDDLERIPKPDLVFVTSMMTYWYPGPHLAISLLKERFPGVPVILGGVYASLCSDFAMENSGTDIVFRGSDMGEMLEMVGNITGENADFKPMDFTGYPPPDYSGYGKLYYCSIMTSAGCPFSCTYCASKRIQPGFFVKSPESVTEEIRYMIENLGVRHFAFYDDALFVNRDKHIVPILENIIRLKSGAKFHTPNGLHARFIDKNLAQLLWKAGFDNIRLSLESTNIKTLEATGSKVRPADIETAVENLLSAGFDPEQIGIYIMMGIPGQAFEEVDKTIDFIHAAGVQSRLSMFSPIPGTVDFEKTTCGEKQIEDPLCHNGAYQYFSGSWLDFEKRKYLQDKSNTLNNLKFRVPGKQL
jgi:radical SAM superfamily enzyme YgiQ (UPF0313 family)